MNTPFLYDLIISHVSFCPSLVVQWLPDKQSSKDSNVQHLLLGTNTTDDEQNYLVIARVCVPTNFDQSEIQDDTNIRANKITIEKKIPVANQINNIQFMPQNHNIVATKTLSPQLSIYEISNESSFSEPQLKLNGHGRGRCGLAWNPLKSGSLISVSKNNSILLWDIKSNDTGILKEANSVFSAHKSMVESVSWHSTHENVFCSAGNDKEVILWDIRTKNLLLKYGGHTGKIYDISFNPFNEWIFAAASSDHQVYLWDLRNQSSPMYSLFGHDSEVTKISWAPFCESILASLNDTKIFVRDLSKINYEHKQQRTDDLNKIPELMFVHGGHISKVCDFSWNLKENWSIASVDESSVVQIWQIAKHIYTD